VVVNKFDTRIEGQKLVVRADEYNSFSAAAKAHESSVLNQGAPVVATDTKPGILNVKNESSQDFRQYRAIALDKPIFTPEDGGENSFKAQVSFRGDLYKVDEEKFENPLQFGITLEPIIVDKIGLVMIKGTTQARIDVKNEDHRYCRLKDNKDILETAVSGPGRILYKEDGLGEKWAYIDISVDDNQRVLIVNDSGETIPEGGAMLVDSIDGVPNKFKVKKPDRDNALNILPLVGPDLPSGASRWQSTDPLMIFKLNEVDTEDIKPGSFLGTEENKFELTDNRFGWLVMGTIRGQGEASDFAICRYNGITPVLKAQEDEDEDEGTIAVKFVDVFGNTDPNADDFDLDVIPEGEE